MPVRLEPLPVTSPPRWCRADRLPSQSSPVPRPSSQLTDGSASAFPTGNSVGVLECAGRASIGKPWIVDDHRRDR